MIERNTALRKVCPRLLLPALCSAWLLLGVHSASAQSSPEFLAEHGDWKAYTYVENGKNVCYIYSEPTATDGNYKRRGDPHAMVTRRQGSKTVEEVSVTSGYPYKEKSKVKMRIDGRAFDFGLTHQEHAWADDEAEDKTVIDAMIRGNKLTVRGTSQKDTFSVDTYSLRGFTAARKAIIKACP